MKIEWIVFGLSKSSEHGYGHSCVEEYRQPVLSQKKALVNKIA